MRFLTASIAAFALAAPSLAKDADQAPAPSPDQIIEQATGDEWVMIPADDLLVVTLAPDRDGVPREVVIQLMPAPFSQGWVENIRLLAREEWYDGTAVIRVQDNYVTQWGDPDADSENAKPLPEGLKVMDEGDYDVSLPTNAAHKLPEKLQSRVNRAAEMVQGTDRAMDIAWLLRKAYNLDPYAVINQPYRGWPFGLDLYSNSAGEEFFDLWPTHCYGMVGVARDLSPNTGDGSSLYTVIGHAPRHLDRNIALVGRVIEGMEHLSSLPRGKGDLGFYEDPTKRTRILSVKVASDLPFDDIPLFKYLSTESETFARYAEARANRRDPFFIHPAGGADICNIPVPVRRVVTD